MIKVDINGEKQILIPEQISALVLQEMKTLAENYLGNNARIEKAVITVPAYFNDGQRKATEDAAKIAGLEVLQIINEPTAAALTYGVRMNQDQSQNLLVFDLGGGTLDVSVVNIEDEVFKVESTFGDTHLGGEDFDYALLTHFKNKIHEQNGIEIKKNDA